MPIRWSAIKVSEAMDKVEEQINLAIPYFEEARNIAEKAKGIENLPQYVDQHIYRLIDELTRAIGGGYHDPIGRPRAAIKSVLGDIPAGAIEAELAKTKYGDQVALL